jgi:hypothetical protein
MWMPAGGDVASEAAAPAPEAPGEDEVAAVAASVVDAAAACGAGPRGKSVHHTVQRQCPLPVSDTTALVVVPE